MPALQTNAGRRLGLRMVEDMAITMDGRLLLRAL